MPHNQKRHDKTHSHRTCWTQNNKHQKRHMNSTYSTTDKDTIKGHSRKHVTSVLERVEKHTKKQISSKFRQNFITALVVEVFALIAKAQQEQISSKFRQNFITALAGLCLNCKNWKKEQISSKCRQNFITALVVEVFALIAKAHERTNFIKISSKLHHGRPCFPCASICSFFFLEKCCLWLCFCRRSCATLFATIKPCPKGLAETPQDTNNNRHWHRTC